MIKAAWHNRNLDFMKRRAVRNDRLLGSYLEVVDDTTPQSYSLLVKGGYLPPNGFVGVNDSPEAIVSHPANPPYHLFSEDAFSLAVRLSRISSEDLRRARIPAPIVAYNFDIQRNADAEGDFWPGHWEQLHEIALNTYGRSNLCVIILNMALHRCFLHEREFSRADAVRHHADKVYEAFRALPVRGLTPNALLGDNLSALNAELDLKGKESGAFQVYRKTAVPMVTLRIAFANGQALCGFSQPPRARTPYRSLTI